MTCSTGPLARSTSCRLDSLSTTWSCRLVKSRTGQTTDSSSAFTSAAPANSEGAARSGGPGEAGRRRRPGVGARDTAPRGDARADAGGDLVATVDHRLYEGQRVGVGRGE